jgi:2-keto-4-pentenoate hydratase
MNEVTSRRAAEVIWRAWCGGAVIEALPDGARPASRSEGYEVQAALEMLSGSPRVGWKIAATSTAGQKHIGVSGPLAGRILGSRVVPDGASVSIASNRMRVAEPEFAFCFRVALPPRAQSYDTTEVLAAVGSLHLAIELPDSRFRDFASAGEPALLADNACARDLVLGGPVEVDWRAVNLARHEVRATVQGRYERAGIGSNVLGDPRLALTWIVNELSVLGITMMAGELVTTGTCMVPLDILPGDQVRADFGILGQIGVDIAAT